MKVKVVADERWAQPGEMLVCDTEIISVYKLNPGVEETGPTRLFICHPSDAHRLTTGFEADPEVELIP